MYPLSIVPDSSLTYIRSLERIRDYLQIPHEESTTCDSRIPPAYWPASGELRVEKLSARYSDGMISVP